VSLEVTSEVTTKEGDNQKSLELIIKTTGLEIVSKSEEHLPCGHPITDDYAHNDPNPGATHFCVSCAKENKG
tara:strand:- start:8799 stop:9014 length:216 start_codon:yes stop_codon:yes gene_type:complete